MAPGWYDGGKRVLDLVLATGLLVALSPVMVGCAFAVWWADGAPVLFRQERVGRHGRPFRIAKFRTMQAAAGSAVTAAADPRVTPLGRILRGSKLDELPQLWNVLVGEMSLVGPRPEVPRYAAGAARGFRAIAGLRPGLTDWASLALRDEERILARHAGDPHFYQEVLLPRKLALARLYQRHRSLGVDLRLIAATGCLGAGFSAAARRLAGPGLLDRARRGLGQDRGASVR